MILNGLGGLVKTYPHIPGLDLAGTVVHSQSDQFQPGDQVICTGWRVGEIHWGGYAQKARLKADWLVPLPAGLTLRTAMGLGAAGLTAAISLEALEATASHPTKAKSSSPGRPAASAPYPSCSSLRSATKSPHPPAAPNSNPI